MNPGPAISTRSHTSASSAAATTASATCRGGRFSTFARPIARSAWKSARSERRTIASTAACSSPKALPTARCSRAASAVRGSSECKAAFGFGTAVLGSLRPRSIRAGGRAPRCRHSQMKKSKPAANPDAYVAALRGWRRRCVEELRDTVRKSAALEERIKWGHLVYFSNGPVLLIRGEDERVLFGFWRGQRLTSIEPRLKGGGK